MLLIQFTILSSRTQRTASIRHRVAELGHRTVDTAPNLVRGCVVLAAQSPNRFREGSNLSDRKVHSPILKSPFK